MGRGGSLETFSGEAHLKKTPCILTDDTISNPTLGLFNHLYFIVENPKTGLELQNTFFKLGVNFICSSDSIIRK